MNTNTMRLFVGALAVSLPGLASAQTDDCAAPTAISGTGSFADDTSINTASGLDFGGAPCETTMNEDVFWVWTSGPLATPVTFSTCTASYDTQLQVSQGSDCSAVCLANNDDSCGLQSSITLAALAPGTQVLIQAGSYAAGGGPSTLDIFVPPPPAPPGTNDDCSIPDPLVGLGSFSFNNTIATASGFKGGEFASNGVHPCFPHDTQTGLEQQIAGDLFFTWTAPCSGDFQIDTEGTSGITDTKVNIHLGSDCNAVCYQGDDDDGTGLLSLVLLAGVTAGDQFLIQVGMYQATTVPGDGVLNINSIGAGCAPSNTSIVCDPPMPHYLGGAATLSGSTLGNAFGSGLHLECTGGPPAEFGFFMVSSTANANLNIFNGTLCLDLPAGRYNPNVATNQANPELNSLAQFDANGVLLSIVGNGMGASQNGFNVPSELPFSPAGQLISMGDTDFFQCWYRDQVGPFPNPGSSANFSNVLQVQF